jgi:CheY-like chemotaxis protein
MILIVDDDEDVRATISQALDILSYPSSEAEDGSAALAMIRRAPPHAVILDYAMPGMSGSEVAAEIARIDPTLPIIFASGYADEAGLRELLGDTFPILHKPFMIGDLAELLEQALDGRPSKASDPIRS